MKAFVQRLFIIALPISQKPYISRSLALQKADVILLLGARLNWILHFGRPPRFHPKVTFIQIDICAEASNDTPENTLALQG